MTNSSCTFYPNYIIIELTSRCNLRCIMCAINEDKRLQKGGEWYGDLDPRVIRNMESVFPKIARIDLNGHGESLLSPIFLGLLEKIKCNKTYVGLTTNAILIDKAMAEAMVRNKLDEIIISIHAAEPELYAEISRPGSFDKLMDNIATVNQYKKEYKTNLPVLKFQFVAQKRNIHQLEDLITIAKRMNISELSVLHLAEYSLVKGESLINYPDLVNKYVPAAIRCAENLGIKLHIPELYLNMLTRRKQPNPGLLASFVKNIKSLYKNIGKVSSNEPMVRNCLDPWNFFFVMQSGRTRPCCVIEDNMGNLIDQSFDEVWLGEKYNKLRGSILSNNPPKECVSCNSRPLTTLSHLKAMVSAKTA